MMQRTVSLLAWLALVSMTTLNAAEFRQRVLLAIEGDSLSMRQRLEVSTQDVPQTGFGKPAPVGQQGNSSPHRAQLKWYNENNELVETQWLDDPQVRRAPIPPAGAGLHASTTTQVLAWLVDGPVTAVTLEVWLPSRPAESATTRFWRLRLD